MKGRYFLRCECKDIRVCNRKLAAIRFFSRESFLFDIVSILHYIGLGISVKVSGL